jgi:hypothetical protein
MRIEAPIHSVQTFETRGELFCDESRDQFITWVVVKEVHRRESRAKSLVYSRIE